MIEKILIVSLSGLCLLFGFWGGWASRGDYEKWKASHPQPTELEIQTAIYNPEERIGGGYRDGKFVYLKDVAQ